jgi:hypothetical protein
MTDDGHGVTFSQALQTKPFTAIRSKNSRQKYHHRSIRFLSWMEMMMWNSFTKSKKKIIRTRHYYTDRNHFEQSFDIYSSCASNEVAATENNHEQERLHPKGDRHTVVILVVGSGWMGHCWWIYSMTSWWNSGGPINIAHIPNTTCVCVRHRGAYFQCPKLSLHEEWLSFLFGIFVIGGLLFGGMSLWGSCSALPPFLILMGFMTTILLLYMLLEYSSRGAASFDDMLHDVAQAMACYFDHHHKRQSSSPNDTAIYFGGYSSGAHVALTLLQRSDVWNNYLSTKPPTQLLNGILIISGVLAVRPETIPLPAPSSSNNKKQTTFMSLGHDKPQWLTNWVMQTVWGKDRQHDIPSPIAQEQFPKLPHLIVGNVCELCFGWCSPWLDVFFLGSPEIYVEILLAHGIPGRYRPVHSDHWNILASPQLRHILREELLVRKS